MDIRQRDTRCFRIGAKYQARVAGGRGRGRPRGFRFRQNARLKGSAARGLFAPRGEQCKQWPGRSAAVSPGLRGEYNYIMNPITI